MARRALDTLGAVLGLLLCWAWLTLTSAATVSYIGDDVQILFGNVTFYGPISNSTLQRSGYKLNITTLSNGPIYQEEDRGHFKLKFYLQTVNYGSLTGMTDCILIGSKAADVTDMILSTDLNGADGSNQYVYKLHTLLSVQTKKFMNHATHVAHSTIAYTLNTYTIHLDGPELLSFNAYLLRSTCTKPRVVGSWEDPNRWSTGVLPTAVDTVIIPATAGIIRLNQDHTVGALQTLGGMVLGDVASCPNDWFPHPTMNPSTKCYKMVQSPVLDFYSAEQACHESALGSLDAHLVQISDAEELLVVQRICRGQPDTVPTKSGCWIGLADPKGIGRYSWIQPETVRNNTFRDWRRYEYNNHTFSEGLPTNGELCVQIVPWQGDALILEQGSFNDVACKLQKPYVCQIFAKTVRYTLTVVGASTLNGGGIHGGNLIMQGQAKLLNYYAWRASTLRVMSTATNNELTKVLMEDGSNLIVDADIKTTSKAYVGESRDIKDPKAQLYMQSYFTINNNANWQITGTGYEVDIYARSTFVAKIFVSDGITFNLRQGGKLYQSQISLIGASSYLFLGGASSMSGYDSYELKLQHRGPVIGEYQNSVGTERVDPTTGLFDIKGVFRLKLYGGTPYQLQTTDCIPYHSTAEDLAVILSKLTMVQDRGGITVRRYGDGQDPLFGYGYTYRIEMDAPNTAHFALGSFSLDVSCYGIHSCNCAETKVPLTDPTGQRMCMRRDGNSSRIDGNACVIPPIINVNQVTKLSYTKTFGLGSLIIDTGVHRLPPEAAVLISSASTGLGIVGADTINWGGIAVDGIGTIIVAGTSWASWDAASVLFGPDWWDIRGYVKMLETAPAFNMYVDRFVLAGLGSILAASPRSNMTWSSGTWNGGTVGGRSRLNILGAVQAGGTNKALRYGITVMIHEGANFVWSSGNISLANGASIICEGKFRLNTLGDRKFIGEAHLLDSAVPAFKDMLRLEPTLNWHGYFGLELPAELRGGFYRNPLCGDQCTRENYMWFRQHAECIIASNTNTAFNLPLNLLGFSQLTMGTNAYVEMASGGICGNNVVVDINQGTIFSFSGGRMSMRATCKVQGQGELLIAGGAHDMSFSIDAHITIAGGLMIWPLSRGPGSTITFNGGLEIRANGRLQIEPYSTRIIVYGEVLFKDDCFLQFPMIGTAAQATNSDRPDAPDPTPRGALVAVNLLTFKGGTLRGKADFIAEGVLYLSGGLKQIRSMAKLVNKGYAEWDSGDILMADNADFMNQGTVQMAKGNLYFTANNLYQGTVLPTESGGDVFALNFHSYDLDSGWLSYLDYVQLRTQYVSRAPVGWTEADQDMTVFTPMNII